MERNGKKKEKRILALKNRHITEMKLGGKEKIV